jgi:hypothetical protein
MRTALLAMILFSVPAYANMKGGDLYAACTSPAGSTSDTICQAYVNGLLHGLLGAELEGERGTPICVPDSGNTAQVRELLVRFFAANQEALYFDAATVVPIAMQRAWPCKARN